jgi:hypothetical protein
MKAVQVGILAALVVCAGLLFKVYRGQQAQAPSVQPQAAATVTPVTPADSPAPAPPAVTADNSAPAPEPPKAEPAHRRPSSLRSTSRKHPELVAENRTPDPAPPTPVQAAPAQAAVPAPTPAPQQEALPNPPNMEPLAPPPPREPHKATIPAGTVVTVRLGETLSTQKNHPGDTFSGTLDQPLVVDGFAIAERGSRVQGRITDLEQAGRVKGLAQISLQLTKLHTADGQDIAISTEKFAKEGPTSHKEDAEKVGIGAVLGAAIGAMAGGGKGAAIGAGAGGAAGAGTVAATRGKPAELPVETRLTFRIEQAVTVTERLQ